MPILDTTFLIDLERGLPAAQQALDGAQRGRGALIVPAQAAAEYISGFEDPVANLADLEHSFEVRDVGRDQILEIARIARHAMASGRFPGWADVQIAAEAALHGDSVLTANPEHFLGLGVRVWNYRRDPQDADESSR